MPDDNTGTPQGTPQGQPGQPAEGSTPPPATKPEGQPAEGSTPPADGGQKKVVPEQYDIKVPEDSLLDAQTPERIATEARERGLSNEEAQALFDREHGAVTRFAESERGKFAEMVNRWAEECKADKEFGGAAFKQSAEDGLRVVAKYGDPDMRDELNRSGFGNNPKLFRMLARIGKAMAEDKLIHAGPAAPGEVSLEDIFYPKDKE